MSRRTKKDLENENAELRGRVAVLEKIVEAYRPAVVTPHAPPVWPMVMPMRPMPGISIPDFTLYPTTICTNTTGCAS